jgi:2-oxoglutarate ferredoxin oxidoreductase subunit beta
MRRGVNMTYILENNGVYGLTKGQFSATADKGSKAKKGATNKDSAIDTVSLALLMGATFVARSFSGDKHQLVPLVKAAIAHQGAAFIDVISPCVAFNNHPGSTKSYDYVREHNEAVNRLDFWPSREAISATYAEGEVIEVPAGAEGAILKLRKLTSDYDATDKVGATTALARAAEKGEVLTGLLYLAPDAEDLHANLNTYEAAFNTLGEKELCPGSAMLDKINAGLR